MKIYLYGPASFTVDKVLQSVKGNLHTERTDLENKMKRVARWQKRLNQLNDPQIVTKVQNLLVQFQELTTKHNITWVDATDKWSSTMYAAYVKGDVSLDLYLDLNVTPDKLWANFYSKKNNAMALRIYIGKEVRITDKILACILKG